MNLLSDQVDGAEINIITRELKRVIDKGITGDVCEFGCYLGTTSVYIAKQIEGCDKTFYVYDSFAGMPEKTNEDSSPLGDSFKPGELLAPKKQFIKNMKQSGVKMPIIKKAWFSDLTIDDIPKKVSFVYLDGDYYRSIVDPLKLLKGRLSSGATIVVDDYSNPALPGVARAIDEWLKRNNAAKKVEHSLAVIYLD